MNISDATTRVLRRVAVGVIAGGGCLLVTATAAHAAQNPSGFSIVDAHSTVKNSGTAAATTGDNKASGNTSSNSSADSNSSSGHVAIDTGAATATGNMASTSVKQTATAGETHSGTSIITQSAGVANRGAATARTGNNGLVGDGSSGPLIRATPGRTTAGSVTSLPTSSGGTTPTVPTTGVRLGVGSAGMPTAPGAAPSGTGTSGSLTTDATTLPVDPLGAVPVRMNRVLGAVSGAGPPDVVTGPASATGNQSSTDISQAASASDTSVSVIDQPVKVSNAGQASASTGHNDSSTGLSTGAATASGNLSTTTVDQSAAATGTSIDLIHQSLEATNAGNAASRTGHSHSSNDLTTGNAGAVGDRATVAASQTANAPSASSGTIARVDQAINANGSGVATATTGTNSVKTDTRNAMTTGNASATGADVSTDVSQATA